MLYYYLIFSVFITFFTFLESFSKKFKYGMLFSFIVIFIFISIRYDFGNDYSMYLYEFHKINTQDNLKGYGGLERLEPGWIYLNKTFKSIGFFPLIAIWSLLYCIVMYNYIRRNLEKKYLFLGVLFFLISSGIFLVELSALRQTLALLIFLASFRFIVNRNIILYSISIYIASLLHSSAFLLLPLYFLNWMGVNNKLSIIYFLLYIFLFFIGDNFSDIINQIILIIKPSYSLYLEDDNNSKVVIGSGFGVIFSAFNFAMLLFFNDKLKQQNSYVELAYKCVIIFYILSPLALSIGMIGRVNFYFSFFQIITIPFVFSVIRNRKIKVLYLMLNLVFSIYGLHNFFSSEVYKEKFGDYKTIFRIDAKD